MSDFQLREGWKASPDYTQTQSKNTNSSMGQCPQSKLQHSVSAKGISLSFVSKEPSSC